MRGQLANLMQQAQRMQDELKRAQEELAQVEVTGQAGGGLVSVTMTARNECRRIRIEPSAMGDKEMLEDLIAAAVNDALNRASEAQQAKMAAATAGLPLPPGVKLPF